MLMSELYIPSYDGIKEIEKDIFLISGWMDSKYLQSLNAIINNSKNDWSQMNEHNGSTEYFWNNKRLPLDLEVHPKRIDDQVFQNKYWVPNPNIISRFLINDFIDEHADNQHGLETKNIDGWGIIAYINDEYSGGELCYSDFGLTIKPSPGDLIIHNSKYIHKSLPIKSGEKYFMTTYTYPLKDRPW